MPKNKEDEYTDTLLVIRELVDFHSTLAHEPVPPTEGTKALITKLEENILTLLETLIETQDEE